MTQTSRTRPRDCDSVIIRREDRVQLVGTDIYGRVTKIGDDPAAVDVLWDDGRASYSAAGVLLVVSR